MYYVLHLVGLQMADHVPAQRTGAKGNLRLGFLHLVFPEQMHTKLRGGTDGFGRLAFAGGQQRDRSGIAPDAGASGFDSFLNGG